VTLSLGGAFDVTIGGVAHRLPAFSAVIIPSNVPHFMTNKSGARARLLEYQPVARQDWLGTVPVPAPTGAPADLLQPVSPVDVSPASTGWTSVGTDARLKTFTGKAIRMRIVDVSARTASVDVVAGEARAQRFVYVLQGHATIAAGAIKRRIDPEIYAEVTPAATSVVVSSTSGETTVVAVFEPAPTPMAQTPARPPAVTGPIARTSAPRDYPFYSTPMDLKKAGYVEEEYFVSGVATRHTVSPQADSAAAAGSMPYTTRIVVRRPADAAKFSGVVVVDWQNVTGGNDVDSEWAYAGGFFVRSGWAWVGASVQRIGVHGFDAPNVLAGRGLKQWNPKRYASLDLTHGGTVTDDSQSYDIYSQIASLLKQPGAVNPLPGMKVRRIYAGGLSQSATFLIRYYNAVHPTARLYDGFLIGLGGSRPRTDLSTKLIKVLSETDVWRGQAAVRVPDTAVTRTWEIAGASHVGAALMSPDTNDYRTILGGLLKRELQPPMLAHEARCTRPPGAAVESWAVYSAAYAALDRWVADDVPPPIAVPIEVSSAVPMPQLSTLVRDASGIARGGIRLPAVAVPTAMHTGENQPGTPANDFSPFCTLFGGTVPFDTATVKAMYKSAELYRREVRRVVDALVKGRFVLADDRPTLVRNAEAAFSKSTAQ
jgi:glyoxylate utilization-related uncharacterized protein